MCLKTATLDVEFVINIPLKELSYIHSTNCVAYGYAFIWRV